MELDALIDALRNTTCGEISCDDCNEQRMQAADELDRMRYEARPHVAEAACNERTEMAQDAARLDEP